MNSCLFKLWRLFILHLAKGKCSECDATTNLHCHHIDRNRNNNCLANGLCLCRRCHSDWHRIHNDDPGSILLIIDNRLAELRSLWSSDPLDWPTADPQRP